HHSNPLASRLAQEHGGVVFLGNRGSTPPLLTNLIGKNTPHIGKIYIIDNVPLDLSSTAVDIPLVIPPNLDHRLQLIESLGPKFCHFSYVEKFGEFYAALARQLEEGRKRLQPLANPGRLGGDTPTD